MNMWQMEKEDVEGRYIVFFFKKKKNLSLLWGTWADSNFYLKSIRSEKNSRKTNKKEYSTPYIFMETSCDTVSGSRGRGFATLLV